MSEKYCVKCNGHVKEHAVLNALAELEETEQGYHLVEDKLLPVIPYVCQTCGFVELYIPRKQLNQ